MAAVFGFGKDPYLSATEAAAAPTMPVDRRLARRTRGPAGSRPWLQVGVGCELLLGRQNIEAGEFPRRKAHLHEESVTKGPIERPKRAVVAGRNKDKEGVEAGSGFAENFPGVWVAAQAVGWEAY